MMSERDGIWAALRAAEKALPGSARGVVVLDDGRGVRGAIEGGWLEQLSAAGVAGKIRVHLTLRGVARCWGQDAPRTLDEARAMAFAQEHADPDAEASVFSDGSIGRRVRGTLADVGLHDELGVAAWLYPTVRAGRASLPDVTELFGAPVAGIIASAMAIDGPTRQSRRGVPLTEAGCNLAVAVIIAVLEAARVHGSPSLRRITDRASALSASVKLTCDGRLLQWLACEITGPIFAVKLQRRGFVIELPGRPMWSGGEREGTAAMAMREDFEPRLSEALFAAGAESVEMNGICGAFGVTFANDPRTDRELEAFILKTVTTIARDVSVARPRRA